VVNFYQTIWYNNPEEKRVVNYGGSSVQHVSPETTKELTLIKVK
jgi:hypothetical protein